MNNTGGNQLVPFAKLYIKRIIIRHSPYWRLPVLFIIHYLFLYDLLAIDNVNTFLSIIDLSTIDIVDRCLGCCVDAIDACSVACSEDESEATVVSPLTRIEGETTRREIVGVACLCVVDVDVSIHAWSCDGVETVLRSIEAECNLTVGYRTLVDSVLSAVCSDRV